MGRMLDIGLPAHPWQASVKGNPDMVISRTGTPDGMVKAPTNGRFVGTDGIPHKARAGDSIPVDAVFTPADGATSFTLPFVTDPLPVAEDDPVLDEDLASGGDPAPSAKKSGKRGPSETTDAAGPNETS